MQHKAKHALWALSQQKLPIPVLRPALSELCNVLYEHMALPLANRGCRHARALALTIKLPSPHMHILSFMKLP